jgi:uncharacterized protein YbaR (Trm112 family)
MHILLTDILTCPRCGPEFGLVLLADEMRERSVDAGRLGCANCRESYPIVHGVVDFGTAGGECLELQGGGAADAGGAGEDAYRVAALLGVADSPAPVLLAGLPVETAGEIARLLPDARIAATAPVGGLRDMPEGPSWLRHGGRLPFRTGSQRGVALSGPGAGGLIDEAARVLQPGGRLVLDPAPEGAARRLEALGMELLLEQDGVVVASLSRPR